ncbi:MAG: YihY/virulence factor BrkB family protein [Akkermansiaceae bacterium]|nr:YihY/virulence factor BrkB family protein [Verrucomicrobiales bacterium]
MPKRLKNFWGVIKTAGSNWVDDKAPRLGAALSYYTVFAIPPLFVIILFIVSLVVDPETVRTMLFAEVGGMIGEKSAEAIQSAMTAQMQSSKGIVASIIAVATLLVTATGLFVELQDALNTVWGVKAKPGQGIISFIRNRMLSFAMVMVIGFLLLVSLVVSAGLSAFGKYVSALVPGLEVLWMITNAVVSFAVVTILFAMIFKVLPDVKVRWRDVWVGAGTTALLFTGGKLLLGLYLGKSSAVSAYGAAGSLVLILLWVYYSAQILFFGAEMTEVYANRFGTHLEPTKNAQWASATDDRPKAQARAKKQASRSPDLAPADRRERLVFNLKKDVESLRAVVCR